MAPVCVTLCLRDTCVCVCACVCVCVCVLAPLDVTEGGSYSTSKFLDPRILTGISTSCFLLPVRGFTSLRLRSLSLLNQPETLIFKIK